MSKKPHHQQWETRRKERETAFQILYALSFLNIPDLDSLKEAWRNFPRESQNYNIGPEPQGFSWQLVRGVWDNEKFLDEDIKKYSHNWRIERMGRVELLVLRMGLYELLHYGTPDKVVISEYLNLAQQFGLENAKSFINGILDTAARANGKDAH